MLHDVHALLDDELLRRVELESARQGKELSEIVGEALELYLDQQEDREEAVSVVTRTWGALPLDKKLVKEVLEQEEDFLGA